MYKQFPCKLILILLLNYVFLLVIIFYWIDFESTTANSFFGMLADMGDSNCI